jgi:hypothetical protein
VLPSSLPDAARRGNVFGSTLKSRDYFVTSTDIEIGFDGV